MERTYTKEEIKARLKWFHGKEFEKYPFIEDDLSLPRSSSLFTSF